MSNLQELEGETIINDRNCLNCKHLVANDDTDFWLQVGEKSYYCNNEHVNINSDDLDDGYLDPDRMEDYAENCIGFEDNEAAIADQLLELQQEFPTLEQLSKNEVAS